MKRWFLAVLLCGVSLCALAAGRVVISGNGDMVRGSGVRAEEAREVAAFDAIRVRGAASVEVTRGEPIACTVVADDNILPILKTEVRGTTLHIEAEKGYSSRIGVKVFLTVPAVTRVGIDGSGDVDLGEAAGDTLAIEIRGSGSVSARGEAETLTARIDGSGNIRAADLVVARADVRINGSGNVSVHAAEALHAEINGSGDITYVGNPPKVEKTVRGSGNIRAR